MRHLNEHYEEDEESSREQEEFTELHGLVALVMVLVLIISTIFFEHLKVELLEHVATKRFEKVVHALFGEMTVLGFLSLCTFCLSHAGSFTELSLRVFDDPEVIEHMFELIHFGFFFVMIVYVFNVTVLIAKAKHIESQWTEFENKCREPNLLQTALEEDKKHRRTMLLRCAFPDIGEMDEFITYRDLRREFHLERELVEPFSPKPVEKRLELSFDYAAYLSKCLEERLGKTGEVCVETWGIFICLAIFFCICDVILDHDRLFLSYLWVAMAFGMYIFNCLFRSHLFQVERGFCAETYDDHVSFDGRKEEILLDKHRLPKWCTIPLDEQSLNHKGINRQQRLFWFHKRGPKAYLIILQTNLVFFAIYWAVLITKHFSYLQHREEDLHTVAQFLIALVPALLCTNQWTSLVASVAHVCSIGYLRKPSIVARVVRGQKVESMIRAFLILQQVVRAVAAVHKQKDQTTVGVCKDVEETKGRTVDIAPHPVKLAFEALDESGDGLLQPGELQRLMVRFGMPVTEEMTRKIFEVLDIDNDGSICKTEFRMFYDEYVVRHKEEFSFQQVAKALFDIFDTDSSGDISVLEFKDTLEAFNLGFSLEDVGELVRELDTDGDNVIHLHQFEMLVKKYYPKDIDPKSLGRSIH